jgi:hypothetical protein
MDRKLKEKVGDHIVGGARHVDDFFIGVRSETDAQIVLSALREVLAGYRFQLNDLKTKITSGLEPLNDLWAQELRSDVRQITRWGAERDSFIRVLNKATELARQIRSDSPVKIVLRAYDDANIHAPYSHWEHVEPYLQRICFHHPHCIDYVYLLVVKRFASNGSFDQDGWQAVAAELISRHSALGHDHEVVWSVWLMIVTGLDISDEMMLSLTRYDNVYVNSLLVSAFVEGKISKRPKLSYGNGIASEGPRWLENLVARRSGFSKAKISGDFSAEFLHLANKGLRLIIWDAHIDKMRQQFVSAISHTRYGYDSDDEGEDQDEDEDGFPY